MPSEPSLQALRALLAGDPQRLVERWLDDAAARSWHLRLAPRGRAELQARAEAVLAGFAESLQGATSLASGGPALREPIQRLAFVTGWIAGLGWPIGAALALAQALRDVLELPAALGDDLLLVAAESYVSGVRELALVRRRELVAQSQVVCLLRPSLVALWLVADPEGAVLEDALGRWLMLAVMNDARQLLLDATLLSAPAPTLDRALRLLAGQPEPLNGRQLLLVAPGAQGIVDACVAAAALPLRVVESVALALDETAPGEGPAAAGEPRPAPRPDESAPAERRRD